jgi:hypothetical protein
MLGDMVRDAGHHGSDSTADQQPSVATGVVPNHGDQASAGNVDDRFEAEPDQQPDTQPR